jgi:hypothetical protein
VRKCGLNKPQLTGNIVLFPEGEQLDVLSVAIDLENLMSFYTILNIKAIT